MVEIILIGAMDPNGVIGNSKENEMPWRLHPYNKDEFYSSIFRQADMAHFKKLTANKDVIMGLNTWNSIPEKYRPLKGRRNNILHPTLKSQNGVTVFNSLFEVFEYIHNLPQHAEVYAMGGAGIYKTFMPYANRLEITRLYELFEGDVYFPKINKDDWELTHLQGSVSSLFDIKGYHFETYIRK